MLGLGGVGEHWTRVWSGLSGGMIEPAVPGEWGEARPGRVGSWRATCRQKKMSSAQTRPADPLRGASRIGVAVDGERVLHTVRAGPVQWPTEALLQKGRQPSEPTSSSSVLSIVFTVPAERGVGIGPCCQTGKGRAVPAEDRLGEACSSPKSAQAGRWAGV